MHNALIDHATVASSKATVGYQEEPCFRGDYRGFCSMPVAGQSLQSGQKGPIRACRYAQNRMQSFLARAEPIVAIVLSCPCLTLRSSLLLFNSIADALPLVGTDDATSAADHWLGTTGNRRVRSKSSAISLTLHRLWPHDMTSGRAIPVSWNRFGMRCRDSQGFKFLGGL